jgi:hypothetical protein
MQNAGNYLVPSSRGRSSLLVECAAWESRKCVVGENKNFRVKNTRNIKQKQHGNMTYVVFQGVSL